MGRKLTVVLLCLSAAVSVMLAGSALYVALGARHVSPVEDWQLDVQKKVFSRFSISRDRAGVLIIKDKDGGGEYLGIPGYGLVRLNPDRRDYLKELRPNAQSEQD